MLIIIAILSLAVPPGTIHHEGGTVSHDEMLQLLDGAQVVFIGEKHDDPLAHRWERFIWEALSSTDRTLALEMFETDVQEILDSYLSGILDLQGFLESSRPWGNYMDDYHPLVAYARKNGLEVIAANVPRHFASTVARQGWEGLRNDPEAGFFMELSVDSANSVYRERFMETMAAIGDQMHSMPMDPLNIYHAQLLKDASPRVRELL